MKIKKIKSFKYKLLKLQLIKLKVYKKKIKKQNYDNTVNIIIKQIELHLKKALQIIYEFHLNNKRIFFIGIPSNFQNNFSKILKKTKHLSIPESIWINGILSNKDATLQFLKSKRLKYIKQKSSQIKNLQPLFYIKKKPDLIIIMDPEIEKNVINEASNLKIPIISLNSNLYTNSKTTYKIPGNFQLIDKKLYNIIFLLLTSIFKKFTFKNYDFYKKAKTQTFIQKIFKFTKKCTKPS